MEKDSDILTLGNILNHIGFTGNGDKNSKRKQFFIEKLVKKVAKGEAEIH